MAAVLNDFQSRTASGVAALVAEWSVAVPATDRELFAVTVPMPTAYVIKHRNGITGWPQEGPS